MKMTKLHELDPALSGLNSELASFIASLIEQNAELAEELEHLDSLTELAEKTVIEASKEADVIKSAAKREANIRASISAEVEASTEAAEQDVVKDNPKAEEEVLLLRKDTELLLALRQRPPQSPPEGTQELCATLDSDERMKTACDVQVEELIENHSCAKQDGDAEGSPAYYADFVDMVLPPPIALGGMLKLHKQLNKYPGVTVIAVTGSLDKGLWIRFIVCTHTPLLKVFEALAEVDRLSYAVTEVGKVYSAQRESL
ncbi:MAG: hypothetical protein NTX81_02065 [Candidatus Bathyarchaeota archaeon]|nr:hypothetical protein [Candidatus Bathyarchaeota archaeon]